MYVRLASDIYWLIAQVFKRSAKLMQTYQIFMHNYSHFYARIQSRMIKQTAYACRWTVRINRSFMKNISKLIVSYVNIILKLHEFTMNLRSLLQKLSVFHVFSNYKFFLYVFGNSHVTYSEIVGNMFCWRFYLRKMRLLFGQLAIRKKNLHEEMFKYSYLH